MTSPRPTGWLGPLGTLACLLLATPSTAAPTVLVLAPRPADTRWQSTAVARSAETVAAAFRDAGVEVIARRGAAVTLDAAVADARARSTAEEPLFVYLVGNGDREGAAIADGRASPDRLAAAFAEVPAAYRLLLVDLVEPRFPEDGEGTRDARTFGGADDSPAGVWADAEDPDAFAPAELGRSALAHALASAVRGAADADGDGIVTVGELVGHLATELAIPIPPPPASAERATVTQRERAEVVLGLPRTAARYRIYDRSERQLLATLRPREGGSDWVAAGPGRFVILDQPTEVARGAAAVSLPWGGAAAVDSSDFEPFDQTPRLIYGWFRDLPPLPVNELLLGYAFTGLARFSSTGGDRLALGHRVNLRYARAIALSLAWELGIEGGVFDTFDDWRVEEEVYAEVYGGLQVATSHERGRLGVVTSFGLALRWLRETLVRVSDRRVVTDNHAVTLGARGRLGLRIAVGGWWSVEVAFAGGIYFPSLPDGYGWWFEGGPEVAVLTRF